MKSDSRYGSVGLLQEAVIAIIVVMAQQNKVFMQNRFTKKIIAASLSLVLTLPVMYVIAEPVLAQSANDNVIVTLTVDSGITISDGADVTMAPNIGIASDSSIGSSSWIVRTNDPDGYTLAVKASTAPALASAGSNFADYTEASTGVPEAWSVGAGAKEFGYSAYGTDTSTGTWGTAASCGSGGLPAGAQKYVGFQTTDKTIATRATTTSTSGVTTTICFAAQQNAIYAQAGVYTATITATATVL